ncbi:Type II secretion system (T2SS)-associated protein Gcp12 [Andalucia godoyi]|uniref:Type II secretion system (T2SS)-associated protein Gcp12 n=1 Tax=Andalucia godoyi TaxID=505711 RepID=A0A8K0F175_ANDGO|nr:Type II secretion system (T2SS)-associated protein Gcp12 [Andalucia godoyi]|eukprot:ANDGO_01995.mRNA.1 Type II secretion system (T2SS)-associated protein Gcp12
MMTQVSSDGIPVMENALAVSRRDANEGGSRNGESNGNGDALSELGVRSQRLSDAYVVRQQVFQPASLLSRAFQKATSSLIGVVVEYLFPRVLENSGVIGQLFFVKSTSVRLLCGVPCADGHPCALHEGHSGSHKCVFGHWNQDPVPHCSYTCDCRNCDAACSLHPGHRGPHHCHFNHNWSDIPGSTGELQAFRTDKSIGDYIDELAYASPDEIRYAYVPPVLDDKDERWTESDQSIREKSRSSRGEQPLEKMSNLEILRTILESTHVGESDL